MGMRTRLRDKTLPADTMEVAVLPIFIPRLFHRDVILYWREMLPALLDTLTGRFHYPENLDPEQTIRRSSQERLADCSG